MKRISDKLKTTVSLDTNLGSATPLVPIMVQDKYLKEAHSLTRLNISSFGEDIASEVSKLSEQVVSQTTVSEVGEFGKGMVQIMTLTQRVDPTKLTMNKGSGLLSKLKNLFIETKEQVVAQFASVKSEIDKIEQTLVTHISSMTNQNVFLESMYSANVKEYNNLEGAIKALDRLKTDETDKLGRMQASNPSDGFAMQTIADQQDFITKIDKRLDRLRRIQHVALLTAPEIRSIQNGNINCIDKFQDITTTTLPAWKKQLSLVILALNQKDEAALGNAIDDKTNEFFNRAADLSGQNRVEVAKLSQRSVLDMSTLQHMQDVLISSTREATEIAKTGEADRTAAVQKLADMRTQLKSEFNPTTGMKRIQVTQ